MRFPTISKAVGLQILTAELSKKKNTDKQTKLRLLETAAIKRVGKIVPDANGEFQVQNFKCIVYDRKTNNVVC